MRPFLVALSVLGSLMAWVLLLVGGLQVCCPGDGVAGQIPAGDAFLTSTNWSASAFSHHAGGTVCWVTGEDGSLRVEVLRDAVSKPDSAPDVGQGGAPDLAPLFTWTGDGWTLVLGPDDEGTLNAWGREWRPVPVSLAQLVRLVTASVRYYPTRPGEFSFARAVGPSGPGNDILRPKILGPASSRLKNEEVWRYQLATLDLDATENEETPSFRRNMTDRGRGSGGRSEILELRWSPAGDLGGFNLSIGSSRRPGALHLEAPWKQALESREPEVFTPLWPLAQFFAPR